MSFKLYGWQDFNVPEILEPVVEMGVCITMMLFVVEGNNNGEERCII